MVPVMTYAFEILGSDILRKMELLQIKFYKHALYVVVHRYTNSDIVYGELEVYPLKISIQCRRMNYWSRPIMEKNTKLSYVIYTCLLQLHMSGVYSSPWLNFIKSICIECGLSGVWLPHNISTKK